MGVQQNKNQERNTLGLKILGKYFDFDAELIVFIVMGLEECPTTRRPHLQCYAQFGKQIQSLGLLKETFGDNSFHFDEKDSDRGVEGNIRYCQKQGIFIRFGKIKREEHGI